jgi:hypothetical protein
MKNDKGKEQSNIISLQEEKKVDTFSIVQALEYLVGEAERCGEQDMKMVLESALKVCVSIYYLQIRDAYLGRDLASLNS